MGNIIKLENVKNIRNIIDKYIEYNKQKKFSIIDYIEFNSIDTFFDHIDENNNYIELNLISNKYNLCFIIKIDINVNTNEGTYLDKTYIINNKTIYISYEYDYDYNLCNYCKIFINNIYILKEKYKIIEKELKIEHNNYIIIKRINKLINTIRFNIIKKNNASQIIYLFYYYNYNYKYYLLNKSQKYKKMLNINIKNIINNYYNINILIY